MFETRMETLDAAIATQMLEKNTDNRNVVLKRVALYMDDMVNGFWLPTHQGIAIDETGNILDGQHRLRALVEADRIRPGVTIQMLVSRQVSRDTFPLVDQGLPRSPQSFIKGNYAVPRIALARFMLMAEAEDGMFRMTQQKGGTLPTHTVLNYLNENQAMYDYGMTFAPMASWARRSFPGTTTSGLLIGGFLAGMQGKAEFDESIWARWWDDAQAIRNNDGLPKGNPLRALAASSPVGGAYTNLAFYRAAYAGIKYRKGEDLRVIRVANEGVLRLW